MESEHYSTEKVLLYTERRGTIKEYLMDYRGPDFLTIYDLAPTPPPSGDTNEDWERLNRDNLLIVGGGGNEIMRRRESLVLYNTVH